MLTDSAFSCGVPRAHGGVGTGLWMWIASDSLPDDPTSATESPQHTVEPTGYQETTGLATFDPETTPSEEQGDKQVRMMCLKLFLTPVQGVLE